ncbi:exported hypothetical protein [Massilia sp. 9I]|nr:exported hypothetical protein [Massilia sp. 9I]
MQLLSTRYISALVIFLASVDAEAVGAGCASGKQSLRVKIFGDSRVRLGKPVSLNVLVENTGQSELKLPKPMVPRYYWLRFQVRNEQGKVLEWRGPEPKLLYENERVSLYPEYSYGRFFNNLEEALDFSKPGKYSIRATWGIGPDGNCASGEYRSREFILHVIP